MNKMRNPMRNRSRPMRYEVRDVETLARLHFLLQLAVQIAVIRSGQSSRTLLLEAASQALLEEIAENVPQRIGIPLLDRIAEEVFGPGVCDECAAGEDKANHPGTRTPQ